MDVKDLESRFDLIKVLAVRVLKRRNTLCQEPAQILEALRSVTPNIFNDDISIQP